MKLIDVLNHTNTIEKTAFYKILNNLIENHDTNQIEEILNESVRHLKDIENESIAKVFVLLRDEYKKFIKAELGENLSQLDIFIDILIRDGNAILQDDWFENLYRKELDHLSKASKEFNKLIEGDSKDLDDQRRRDYQIYKSCVLTAYTNDETNNLDKKVTSDEYSMLRTLAQELELSNEEVRLINFNIVPLEAIKIDAIIKDLKDIGIVFYHKKERQVFTPDESLKDELSTNKDKMDIILNVGNKEVIIVECKTDKSSKYNKFSACSRQIKSYQKQAERSSYRVVKTLLVAPDFTPDFVQECDLDLDVNLSLISSDVLFNIWNGFKKASHQVFPVNLLMRDALISDDKILEALKVK